MIRNPFSPIKKKKLLNATKKKKKKIIIDICKSSIIPKAY